MTGKVAIVTGGNKVRSHSLTNLNDEFKIELSKVAARG